MDNKQMLLYSSVFASTEDKRICIGSSMNFNYEAIPVEAVEWNQAGSGDCKTDHGERTNNKLRDQPFYMRGRNGKMRGY